MVLDVMKEKLYASRKACNGRMSSFLVWDVGVREASQRKHI